MSDEKYTSERKKMSFILIAAQIAVFLFIFIVAVFFLFNINANNDKVVDKMVMSIVEEDLKTEVTNIIKQMEQMRINTTSEAMRMVDLLCTYTDINVISKEELQKRIQTANELLYAPMVEALWIQDGQKWLISTTEKRLLSDTEYSIWLENAEYLTELSFLNRTVIFAASKEGIRNQAVEQIRVMIHGQVHQNSNKYAWVNEIINMEGGDNYAIRRIHPNLVDTEGMLLSTSIQDITGAYPYLEELEGIQENGEILYTYHFKNLLNDEVELKVTYACYYEPFQWVVAMGEPISDIIAKADGIKSYTTQQMKKLSVIFFVVNIVLLLIDIVILHNISDGVLNILKEKEALRRKELEEALKKTEYASKAKTTFLFNMSHDIRTPMNAIIGFIRVAKNHMNEKEKMIDALEKADISSHHMLSIVNDVLDMARIESGEIELHLERVVPEEHIKYIKEIHSQTITEKGIHFTVDIGTIADTVLVDGTRVMQVISNLLSNAIKFTPSGGSIWLTVRQTRVDEDGKLCFEIRVKDTGIGMEEEFQKKVFLPFERERNATASGVQGTGLGLSIAKKIAIAMNGDLTFTSVWGEGTEFVFTFEAEQAEPLVEEAKSLPQEEFVDFTGKRILIVEDIELNREIAVEILTSEGFIVEEAEDGMIAVDIIAKSEPGYYDLILMDIQMPVMNGYVATQKIRALEDPLLATIPIVAMTANAFAEDCKQAFDVGMNGHIAKPIDVEKLLEVLRNIILAKYQVTKKIY